MQLKSVDMIISNNESEYKFCEIAFSIMNLAAGGIAIIRIPRITGAIIPIVHLFTRCFSRTYILHTVAEDRIFLCGEEFLDSLTSKHCRLLSARCEESPMASPFTPEYAKSDSFVETVTDIMRVGRAIQTWRYEYYEKMFMLHQRLKSASAILFAARADDLLADNYKDMSEDWIATTRFNFCV